MPLNAPVDGCLCPAPRKSPNWLPQVGWHARSWPVRGLSPLHATVNYLKDPPEYAGDSRPCRETRQAAALQDIAEYCAGGRISQ